MNILNLPRYGNLGASSRLRSYQYLEIFADHNLACCSHPMFNDETLRTRYRVGRYGISNLVHAYWRRFRALRSRKHFDLIWIEKEALPWLPLWVELFFLKGVRFVLDYDDALFHNYDLHRFAFVRKIFGRRLDGLMSKATLVVCGNSYLARRAKQAGAEWVVVIPTVIDLTRYPLPQITQKKVASEKLTIVWIGSPSTQRYLDMIAAQLQELACRVPFVFRIIGGNMDENQIPSGVDVEYLSWSEETEVAHIAECDIGIMPLFDTPWEHGKCGYKLIQYMACGLPVIASPIGVNTSIVQDGINGFFADSSEAWVDKLEILLRDATMRRRMGMAGRSLVESEYSLQVTGPRVAQLLQRAAVSGEA